MTNPDIGIPNHAPRRYNPSMRIRPTFVTAWLLVVSLLAAWPARAGDRPQWGERYTRNMVSDETNLPGRVDFETGLNVKWAADIGNETHGTPVIAGGRVYVGTNNGHPRDSRHRGDRGVLMCFDEKDGRFLWQLVVPKLEGDPFLDWPSGGIVSPPTIEGDRCYVISNRGEVMCLDVNGQANGNQGPFLDEGAHMAKTGEPAMEVTPQDADILWLFDLRKDAGVYQHDSAHASILLHGEFLYLNTSNGTDNTHRRIRCPDAPALVVFDKATGRLLARDHEGMSPRTFHSTWSSPALGEVGGRTLIFFGGPDGVVYAFEALQQAPPPGQVERLKLAWKFDCDPAGPKENIHSYITSENGQYARPNRKESPSNIKSMPVFHEGRLYVTAGGDVWWGKRQSWLKCIDPAGSGDVTKTAEIWSYSMPSHCCTTPAIRDGLAFVCDDAGTAHCVDIKTGKACWTHPMHGEVWASVLAADGKVYFGSRGRDFCILACSREKKVLCQVRLDSPLSSTPVAANGVVYVATQKKLYALQKRE